jgi:DNA-binding HxlR family transcriptional regulator
MRRKPFTHMQCPVARSLERVGDWWNILILREAFYGSTRFDEFSENLGIAASTLTRRLDGLVEAGLLERRRYSERPPRDEYLLTELGRDFRPVLLTLMAWGNRHFAPEGRSVELVDPVNGEPIDPVIVDGKRKRPLGRGAVAVVAGNAANARTRRRLALSPLL